MEATFRLEVTGIGREQDAGRLREDHPLHDHGHADLAVVEAVPQAVGDGPLGEERGPAPADVLRGSLPAPRRSGRCPAGPRTRPSAGPPPSRWSGPRRRLCSPSRASGRVIAAARSSGMATPSSVRADLGAERADRLPVVRLQARQPIEPIVRSTARSAMIRSKASVVTQKPAGTRMPSILESSPRCAPLPPTTATCVRSISWKPST